MISPVRVPPAAPVVSPRTPATAGSSWSVSRKLGSEVVTFTGSKTVNPGQAPVYRVAIRNSKGTQELRSDQPPKGRDPAKWAAEIRRIAEGGGLNPKQAAKIFGPVADDLAALQAKEIDAEDFAETFATLIPR